MYEVYILNRLVIFTENSTAIVLGISKLHNISSFRNTVAKNHTAKKGQKGKINVNVSSSYAVSTFINSGNFLPPNNNKIAKPIIIHCQGPTIPKNICTAFMILKF